MNTSISGRVYYPALNGLRGFAILLILLFHYFPYLSFLRFGWIGVDLFFVISGFLITGILLKTKDDKSYFKNFYIRRVLRIFPIYYLTLFLFFLLSPYVFSEKGPATVFYYYEANKIWFWLYLQNWVFVYKGMPPEPYLSHFWSLAIEEQFYLLWPLIVFGVSKRANLKRLTLFLIFFAILFRVYLRIRFPDTVETYYCNTFTRMDSVLIGGLLALRLAAGKQISSRFIKLVSFLFFALLASVYFSGNELSQDNLLLSSVGYTCFAMFFSCIIYLCVKAPASFLQKFTDLYVLRYLGKISYGIYVYHMPIYLVLSTFLSKFFPTGVGEQQRLLVISGASVIVTLLVSTASYYLVEKPILSLKKHFV